MAKLFIPTGDRVFLTRCKSPTCSVKSCFLRALSWRAGHPQLTCLKFPVGAWGGAVCRQLHPTFPIYMLHQAALGTSSIQGWGVCVRRACRQGTGCLSCSREGGRGSLGCMVLQKHLWGTSSWLQASWALGVTPAPEMCGYAENSLPRSGQPAWFPGGQLGLLGMGCQQDRPYQGAKQLATGRVPTSLQLVIPTQRTAGGGLEMEMTLGSDIQVPWTMEQGFQVQETRGRRSV